MFARSAVVVIIGGLLSFMVLRTAVAALPPDRRPFGLERVWPGHPLVTADRLMAEVGRSAASGRSPAPTARRDLERLARSAPLAVEPFLVEGALAQIAGRASHAELLFLEARRRDPRSAAARYFLASRYLATNRIPQGLKEIAVLSRVVSGSHAQFVPTLADFARSPGAVPLLKQFFQSSRQTEDEVLALLASDANNAGLILQLASPQRAYAGQSAPAWHAVLVRALVEKGQFAPAHATWARLAGLPASRTLFNPEFRLKLVGPPFNWSFDAGTAGIAEPSDGGLRLVYYGRDDAVLASQLLVLSAGNYLFSAPTRGTGRATGLAWWVTCQPSKQRIAALALAPPGATPAKTSFTVPGAGCAAQLLELKATASEGAQTVELDLPRLDLVRVAR